MRTVTFKSVLDGIAHLTGIDPLSTDFGNEQARSWCAFINNRVREAFDFWPFPELRVTDERAYRTIWSATKQFRRESTTDLVRAGLADELYYIGAGAGHTGVGYYRVLSTASQDPPVGTLPTNATYFEAVTAPEQYIEYDQSCRRAIGEILGVYGGDPRTGQGPSLQSICYRASERGIEVWNGTTTVWVTYLIPPPEFTVTPYDDMATYAKGDRVYHIGPGECYRALAATNGNAPGTAFWAVIPFPRLMSEFVKCAVASDAEDDLQTASKFLSQAYGALQREVDKLLIQGERHFYGMGAPRRTWIGMGLSGFWWSVSPPYTASSVSSLTDQCEDEGGGPVPVTTQALTALYQPTIDGLRTADPATTPLETFDTRNYATGTLIKIVYGTPEAASEWKLKVGTADVAQPSEQVAAYNSDSGATGRYWQKVGGY